MHSPLLPLFSSRLLQKAAGIMSLETSFLNLFVCSKPTHHKLLNKCFVLNLTLLEGVYSNTHVLRNAAVLAKSFVSVFQIFVVRLKCHYHWNVENVKKWVCISPLAFMLPFFLLLCVFSLEKLEENETSFWVVTQRWTKSVVWQL